MHGHVVWFLSPFDPPNANLRVCSVLVVPPDSDGLRHCVRCRFVSTWQPIMGFAAFRVPAILESRCLLVSQPTSGSGCVLTPRQRSTLRSFSLSTSVSYTFSEPLQMPLILADVPKWPAAV